MRRLKEAGADCIKILLYYTPFDPKDVNDKKHAWVERIGDECRANDIPFFLEFVGYEEGADEKGLEYAKKKPQIVAASMAEFTKDRYGVDVMKVEVPDQHEVRRGRKARAGQTAYTRDEAKKLVPGGGEGRDQAVHLSVRRREQRRVHRIAGARLRIRRAVLRRALRPRDVEGRHRRLREGRRRRVPHVARIEGRREHQQRQRGARSRGAVVLVLRRVQRGRARQELGGALLPALVLLFLVSGACGLIYQVLWLRMLGLVFGVTVYSASTVWASFMAGLALGSYLGGKVGDRTKVPLIWFGVVEILVGVSALATPAGLAALQHLYASALPSLPQSFAALTTARAVMSFLVLLVPTLMMGASLPLIIRSSMFRGGTLGSRVDSCTAPIRPAPSSARSRPGCISFQLLALRRRSRPPR